ncbi:MAG: hypothetical protein CL897_05075 [Dehalococcoidia bacterium]|nr:hypothetical protein [Dehalococcoidia bacterium]
MLPLLRFIAPVALVSVLALTTSAPLMALEDSFKARSSIVLPQETAGDRDVVPPLVWAIVGSGLFCASLGVLYLLKRQLGGFELKPNAWKAPITIIASESLPSRESDYPEHGDDGHGH